MHEEYKIKKSTILVPWILLIISFIIIGILLVQLTKKEIPTNITDEIAKTIDAVGKLIILPNNEVPTIATVTDLKPLKGIELFKNAKIGDKVLIYTKLKKAILYNPTENKIVDYGPITIGNNLNI